MVSSPAPPLSTSWPSPPSITSLAFAAKMKSSPSPAAEEVAKAVAELGAAAAREPEHLARRGICYVTPVGAVEDCHVANSGLRSPSFQGPRRTGGKPHRHNAALGQRRYRWTKLARCCRLDRRAVDDVAMKSLPAAVPSALKRRAPTQSQEPAGVLVLLLPGGCADIRDAAHQAVVGDAAASTQGCP